MSGGSSRIGMLLGGIALCCVAALPAGAGDRGGDHPQVYHGLHHSWPNNFRSNVFAGVEGPRGWHHRTRFEHRGFDERLERGGLARTRFRSGDKGFDREHWAGRSHVRYLPMLASNGSSAQRGSGIWFVTPGALRDRPAGSYSGSVDVYRADGGTYVAGYGDGGYGAPNAPLLRPRAKIIDIAKAGDACAYENGVCVIRP